MKYVVELLTALTPFLQAATPMLLLLLPWVFKRINDKAVAAQNKVMAETAAAQTKELKAHSDDNREQIKNTVVSATGTHKTLSDAAP